MATTTIPSLWPTDTIRMDVLTPAAILKIQATELEQISRGLLKGDVTSSRNGDDVEHSFDIIAPALGNYRHRLITLLSKIELVYPVRVESEVEREWCETQDEFVKLLTAILQSNSTMSVIQSLIARSNESAPT